MKILVPSLICFFVSVSSALAMAELRPDRIQVADAKKTQAYLKDGLFIGGDRAVNEVVVKDLRRAANSGFERVVLDLSGNRNGEPVAISRPPYYQVAVSPDEKRVVFTVWGNPKLTLDPKKVKASFAKSAIVDSVVLFPVLDDESWTFAFELKSGAPVEVFELGNPVRIIMDLKTGNVAHAATPTVKKVSKGVHPKSQSNVLTAPAIEKAEDAQAE